MDERGLLLQLVATLPEEPAKRIATIGTLCDAIDRMTSELLTSPAYGETQTPSPANRGET